MVGSVSSGFIDRVTIGGTIEQGLKNDKINNVIGSSNNMKNFFKGFQKKKEGEENDVSINRRRNYQERRRLQFFYRQPAYQSQSI